MHQLLPWLPIPLTVNGKDLYLYEVTGQFSTLARGFIHLPFNNSHSGRALKLSALIEIKDMSWVLIYHFMFGH